MKEFEFLREASLIREAKEGNREAFDELVTAYRPKLLSIGRARGFDASASEDIVQETFINAYRSLHTFRVGCRLLPWRCQICLRCLGEHYGDEKNRRAAALEEAMNFADELPNDQKPSILTNSLLTEGDVLDAVLNLAPEFRVLIGLYEFENRSYEEIADILELPIGTVKSRLFRARNLLFARLSAMETDRRASLR